jgi:hypothetical protein
MSSQHLLPPHRLSTILHPPYTHLLLLTTPIQHSLYCRHRRLLDLLLRRRDMFCVVYNVRFFFFPFPPSSVLILYPSSLVSTNSKPGSFHIFNNHSESVHVFGNQLDYVFPPHSYLILYHPNNNPIARHRDPNVGLNNPFRLLWFLLLPPTAAHILHPRISASRRLRLRNPTSCFPAAGISAVQGCYVRRFRPIFHHTHRSRSGEVWLGNADVAYEFGLDGIYDDV